MAAKTISFGLTAPEARDQIIDSLSVFGEAMKPCLEKLNSCLTAVRMGEELSEPHALLRYFADTIDKGWSVLLDSKRLQLETPAKSSIPQGGAPDGGDAIPP